MDLQCTAFVSHGRSVGENDWGHQKNTGFHDVTSQRESHTWRPCHLHAEVCAIINSRPLSALSTDPEDPFPLSPSLILTQKPDVLVPPDVSFEGKDIYKSQWKRVQHLADVFWKRWSSSYLQSLQSRKKWTDNIKNVAVGDIVLLREPQLRRVGWPMGIISKVFPSSDDKVRKVEVRVSKQSLTHQKPVTYIRPVSELIVLISSDWKWYHFVLDIRRGV